MTNQTIFLRQNGILKKVNFADIVAISIEDNYLRFHLLSGDLMVRGTLDATMEKLPSDLFFRIHRSYAVSVNYIDHIGKDFVVVCDESIPLSRKYYDTFVSKLNVID